MSTTGLRDRKKARTRDALLAEAFQLFAERGYAATTVSDIAAAAEVSPRTFFHYFPSKDDLVLAGMAEKLAEVAEVVRRRAPDETVFDQMRRIAPDLLTESRADWQRLREEISAVSPTVEGRSLLLRDQWAVDVVLPEVARDLGVPVDHPTARLVTGGLMGALHALEQLPHVQGRALRAMIDEVFEFVTAGLAAVR